MAGFMLEKIEVKKNILADEKYKYLFTVEEVNKLVNCQGPKWSVPRCHTK
jgi:argininosuccinate lyase